MVRRAADAGATPRSGRGFFSQSQLSVQTPLRCSYSPKVQRYGLTSVRTLRIPNTGNYAIVCTHENAAERERGRERGGERKRESAIFPQRQLSHVNFFSFRTGSSWQSRVFVLQILRHLNTGFSLALKQENTSVTKLPLPRSEIKTKV